MFETAELLASWPFYDRKAERFVLGPPLIPAQENFEPLETFNPTFELAYWRFGLATAQDWRVRLGMPKDPKWDNVLFRLSKLPVKDGIYLAAESQQDLWERARSPECSNGNTKPECPNRDHPSFVAALWPAARLGRRPRDHAPNVGRRAEGLGPAPDLGLGLAHAGHDRDAPR